MLFIEEMFKLKKPVIAYVHLLPLPGFPGFQCMESVLDAALKDTRALVEGGVDGIIVENLFSRPREKTAGPETVAAMTLCVREIVKEVDVPVGLKVLFNDFKAQLAIAKVCGCEFTRISVYTDVMVTYAGLIEGCQFDAIMYRRRLEAENVKIFADVYVKHAAPLAPRPIEYVAMDTAYGGLADALVLTGPRTGMEVDFEKLQVVKTAVPDRPLFPGSGVTEQNVEKILRVADGVFVGTHLKHQGKTSNPVDISRVKSFMNTIQRIRKTN